MSQYWLVTGGNRGIGLALVEQLSARNDVIVFATVRDPSKLGDLEKVTAQRANVHIVRLRLEVVDDAKQAASEIAKITDHLDVVIANAGIAYNWEPLEKVDPEVAREHLTVKYSRNTNPVSGGSSTFAKEQPAKICSHHNQRCFNDEACSLPSLSSRT